MEGDTNASNGESDERQSDCQMSAGDEEDDEDEESIFPLVVDPVNSGGCSGGEGRTVNAIGYNG